MPVGVEIKDRHGTTAQWIAANPVLAIGETGVEVRTDGTMRSKAGDGTRAWADLPYLSAPALSSGFATLADLPPATPGSTGVEVRTNDGGVYKSIGTAWQTIRDPDGTWVKGRKAKVYVLDYVEALVPGWDPANSINFDCWPAIQMAASMVRRGGVLVCDPFVDVTSGGTLPGGTSPRTLSNPWGANSYLSVSDPTGGSVYYVTRPVVHNDGIRVVGTHSGDSHLTSPPTRNGGVRVSMQQPATIAAAAAAAGTTPAAWWSGMGVFTSASYARGGMSTAPGDPCIFERIGLDGYGNTVGNGIVVTNDSSLFHRVHATNFNGQTPWWNGGVGGTDLLGNALPKLPDFYDPAHAYSTGDLIRYGMVAYKAVAGSTGVTPGTDSSKWVAIVTGTYDAAHTYAFNDLVQYGGFYYKALRAVVGITPADDGTNWSLIGLGDGYGIVVAQHRPDWGVNSGSIVTTRVENCRLGVGMSKVYTEAYGTGGTITDGFIHDSILLETTQASVMTTASDIVLYNGGGWTIKGNHTNHSGGSIVEFVNSISNTRIVGNYFDSWGHAANGRSDLTDLTAAGPCPAFRIPFNNASNGNLFADNTIRCKAGYDWKGAYNGAVTYKPGQMVSRLGTNYHVVSTVASTTGNDPSTDGGVHWSSVPEVGMGQDFGTFILFDFKGKSSSTTGFEITGNVVAREEDLANGGNFLWLFRFSGSTFTGQLNLDLGHNNVGWLTSDPNKTTTKGLGAPVADNPDAVFVAIAASAISSSIPTNFNITSWANTWNRGPAPTNGTWPLGMWRLSADPSTGPRAVVSTAAGTPGTWEDIGVATAMFAPVRLATAAALSGASYASNVLIASGVGALIVDGIAAATGDRILNTFDVAHPERNGIYVVTSPGSGGTAWVLTRADDANTSKLMAPGKLVAVKEGNTLADTGWQVTNDDPFVLGTSAVTFARIWPRGLVSRSAVKTGPYTAAAGELVPVDSTAADVPITLPTAPPDRTQVAVKHILQGGAHVVSVTCGGGDVFNRAGNLTTTATMPLLAQAILLQYDAASAIWTVLADDLPLSALDARYVLDSIYAAKGTALFASAAGVPVAVAVGADGTIIQADSTQVAGVKYAQRSRSIADQHVDVTVVNTVAKTQLASLGVPTTAALGDHYQAIVIGDMKNNNGAATAVTYTFEFVLGGTTIATTNAVSEATSVNRRDFKFIVDIFVLATNSEYVTVAASIATASGAGILTAGTAGQSGVKSAPAAEDLTAGKNLVVNVTMSLADALTDTICHYANLEVAKR